MLVAQPSCSSSYSSSLFAHHSARSFAKLVQTNTMGNLDLLSPPLGPMVATTTSPNTVRNSGLEDYSSVDMNRSPSNVNDRDETRRLSVKRSLGPSDVDLLGETSLPPSAKLCSQEEMNHTCHAKETAGNCSDIPSMDEMQRSLAEVHQLKRQLSKRQESLKEIALEECPSIAWFRKHHRSVQGRIMRRSMSVGCVESQPAKVDASRLQSEESAAARSNPPKLAICSEGQSSRGTRKSRGKRHLTRCMSNPVIGAGNNSTKKRTKKRITRSRTAPICTKASGNEDAYFNWKEWANQKQEHINPEDEAANTRKVKPLLSRHSSTSSLLPTPEGSTLEEGFRWQNRTKSSPRAGTTNEACSAGFDVFDWKEWAKNQSRREKEDRRRRNKRAASERTFHTCRRTGMYRQASSCCRRSCLAAM